MTLKQKKSISSILKYRETHTLKETGKKFNLTSERVRQIQHLKDRKFCPKHKRYHFNSCSYCLGESYRLLLNKLTYVDILKEAKKECKNRKRDYLSTWRRIYLVEILYGRYTKSIGEISELLCRDYSTVSYLLKKIKYAK